jgi:hypothetical protein
MASPKPPSADANSSSQGDWRSSIIRKLIRRALYSALTMLFDRFHSYAHDCLNWNLVTCIL